METKQVNEKLNELVQYLQDSRNGYKECIDCVDNLALKKLFIELSEKRNLMLNELNQTYGFLEAASQENGTLLGKLHQTFTNLKAFLTKNDSIAIVREIKRGENLLIDTYKNLLREPINANLKIVLNKQLMELENDILDIDKKSVEQ